MFKSKKLTPCPADTSHDDTQSKKRKETPRAPKRYAPRSDFFPVEQEPQEASQKQKSCAEGIFPEHQLSRAHQRPSAPQFSRDSNGITSPQSAETLNRRAEFAKTNSQGPATCSGFRVPPHSQASPTTAGAQTSAQPSTRVLPVSTETQALSELSNTEVSPTLLERSEDSARSESSNDPACQNHSERPFQHARASSPNFDVQKPLRRASEPTSSQGQQSSGRTPETENTAKSRSIAPPGSSAYPTAMTAPDSETTRASSYRATGQTRAINTLASLNSDTKPSIGSSADTDSTTQDSARVSFQSKPKIYSPPWLPCQRSLDEDLLQAGTTQPSGDDEAAPRMSLVAYSIVYRSHQAPAWIRCGIAHFNRDGSVNVQLDSLPLNGELHLRPIQRRHLPVSAPPPRGRPEAQARATSKGNPQPA